MGKVSLGAKGAALSYLIASSEAFVATSRIGTFAGSKPGQHARAARPTASQLSMAGSPFQEAKKAVASVAAGLMLASGIAAPAAFADVAPVPQVSQIQQQQTPLAQQVTGEPREIRYSGFVDMVEKDNIEKVTFSADGQKLLAVDTDGARLRLDALPNDPELLSILTKHKVDVTVMPVADKAQGMVGGVLSSLAFPAILFLGLLFLTRRNGDEQGGGGGMGGFGGPGGMGNPMEFAKSQSKIQLQPDTGTKFADVAGCDAAKMELEEVVDFLKNSTKYTELGAQIPRGVILEGPPGTGKTLLARAVAGEAGVPFVAISGSEFVEMFVGVGASRVRDLFGKAKENAPCIIFIDEIDAVGRQRGAGMAGGNDEREQTLNQILTEMDGFQGNSGVIVIAATNRADVLDSALLRPGRFDRRVNVSLPDYNGRIAILKVHARNKPLASDVDLDSIARRTPGYSGASLENLLNEAAIFAARTKKQVIDWVDVDAALDRIMVGLEKKGGWGDATRMKEIVAYHEAGHAIAGALIPDYDMVQKVTIIPRSNGAGGLTFFSPSESRLQSNLYSRQYLEAQLAVALGGRVAEELIFGEDGVTTGASNDLQQVANIAKRMVTQWGMSDKIGQLVIGDGGGGNPFMGRSMGGGGTQWGATITQTVDMEVERMVNNAYVRCKEIIGKNKDLLEKLAARLLEVESVTAEELAVMIMDQGDDLWMAPYGIYDTEDSKRESLPFKEQPTPAYLLGDAAIA